MISDRAIAADLWQRAEAKGKAGYAYPSGLRVAVYVNNGHTHREVWPALTNTRACSKPRS